MKNSTVIVAALTLLLALSSAYALDSCQYASEASATSEADTSKASYATGAPDAPSSGECDAFSGAGYDWNTPEWNMTGNITLKYSTMIDAKNITVIGDYNLCLNNVWAVNSATGEKKQVFIGIDTNCTPTYNLDSSFTADTVVIEKCGWAWSSIDAVRLCGSIDSSPGPACGNGMVETGEECDDGNTANGDGCSSICAFEPNICGNGKLEQPPKYPNSTEQCDDGNNINGDGCTSDCKKENIVGPGCQYAISAEADSAIPEYEAVYATGAPDSDGNCATSPAPKTSWEKTDWNVPSTITLTFAQARPENLIIFGDYELCIDRVWMWRNNAWYLVQAGNIDKGTGSDCRISYTFNNLGFLTDKIRLETCGWRMSAVDAAQVCGASDTYPKVSIISPEQDKIIDSSEKNVILKISTDIPSTCQFSYEKNFQIGEGTGLSTTDGITHTYTLSGISSDSLNIYYKCTSENGKPDPYSIMHRIRFKKIDTPVIEVCNWQNCAEGAASVSVDDGYHPTTGKSEATCMTELDNRGLKGTYFLAYTDIYNQSDWNIWKNAYAKGHEIGGHSVVHDCPNTVPGSGAFISDVQANIADITANVGMHVNELTTYAWPCGVYFSEYDAWLAPYYKFARGYNLNRVESKNPANFMNLNSINTVGFGQAAPDHFLMADEAENYQDWVIYVYHDTCNNPEIFDYVKSKSLWIDTIGSVSKYIKERQTAAIEGRVETGSGVRFYLVSSLDTTVFDEGLTLRIYLGNQSIDNIMINGANAAFTQFTIAGQNYVKFNVPAAKNSTIEISGLNANPPYCGDGAINQVGEECDDGNNINGDGCTSDCKKENKSELAAYIVPYIGDIDGSVGSDWFYVYDTMQQWHDENNVSIAFSFFPRTIKNDTQFSNILANMHTCSDCELVLKGEGINGTDLASMPYDQVKSLLGSDLELFRAAMQMTLNSTNISLPRTYNQIYGRFTPTIRSAIHDLGFNLYLEEFVSEYGYVDPLPDLDITQYSVSFTKSGRAGPTEEFMQPGQIINNLLNLNNSHAIYINGTKVIPLMVHQQDFRAVGADSKFNTEKWALYTETLLLLKNDARFRLLKPQEVYLFRHPNGTPDNSTNTTPPITPPPSGGGGGSGGGVITPPGSGSGNNSGEVNNTLPNQTKNDTGSVPNITACIEKWRCGAWGNCTGGIQTRFCYDSNNCSTYNDAPLMRLPCTAPSAITTSADAVSQPPQTASRETRITGRLLSVIPPDGAGILGVVLAMVFVASYFAGKR